MVSFFNMEKIKITISGENRLVVIPMDYSKEEDSLEINQIQVEPMPEETDDISEDVVMTITRAILSTLRG